MSARESFMIPQLRIEANDAQLRRLQHRMLNDHYERQISQKKDRNLSDLVNSRRSLNTANYSTFATQNFNPESKSIIESGTLHSQADYDIWNKNMQQQNAFKRSLISNYEEQLNNKNQQKLDIKNRQKAQQSEIFQIVKNNVEKDKIRSQLLAQQFKKQAFQQVRQRQQRRSLQKKQLDDQKKAYQHRYSTNALSLNKQQQFKKHFMNVQGAQQANSIAYINKVVPMNNHYAQQKQKLIDKGIQNSQLRMRGELERQYKLASKYRNELKDSLVQQIREKQQKKKRDIAYDKKQGYTSSEYLKMHHPINNPVDFRITHDNRYIIKQLQSKLARSGSQSLI